MKNLFLSAIAVFFSLSLAAQEKKITFQPKFGIQAGVLASTWNNNAMFSSYVMPTISQQISAKWHINAGLMLRSNNFLSNGTNLHRQDAFLMAGASYQATEKLTISGQMLYDPNRPAFGDQFSASRWSAMMSAQYKISDNVSVGVSVRVSQGNSPFSNNAPLMMNNDPIYNNWR